MSWERLSKASVFSLAALLVNIWEIDVGVLIIARDCAAKEAGPSCPKLGNGSEEYLKGHLRGRDAREQKKCTNGAA